MDTLKRKRSDDNDVAYEICRYREDSTCVIKININKNPPLFANNYIDEDITALILDGPEMISTKSLLDKCSNNIKQIYIIERDKLTSEIMKDKMRNNNKIIIINDNLKNFITMNQEIIKNINYFIADFMGTIEGCATGKNIYYPLEDIYKYFELFSKQKCVLLMNSDTRNRKRMKSITYKDYYNIYLLPILTKFQFKIIENDNPQNKIYSRTIHKRGGNFLTWTLALEKDKTIDKNKYKFFKDKRCKNYKGYSEEFVNNNIELL